MVKKKVREIKILKPILAKEEHADHGNIEGKSMYQNEVDVVVAMAL